MKSADDIRKRVQDVVVRERILLTRSVQRYILPFELFEIRDAPTVAIIRDFIYFVTKPKARKKGQSFYIHNMYRDHLRDPYRFIYLVVC